MKRCRTLQYCLVLLAGLLLAGCVNDPIPVTVPAKEMKHIRSFVVEKTKGDEHDVHKLIAEQLVLMGFTATPVDRASAQDEAVVTYDASWDSGKMYLLEIRIALHREGFKPENFSSRSYLERKKPSEMAHELLEFMLDRGLSPFVK